MRGIKLLSVAALAGNYRALHRPQDATSTSSVIQKPLDTVEKPLFGRRKALQSILAGAAVSATAAGFPTASSALDMDAFANGQLEADKKACNPKLDPKCAPKMTEAEALCKYGQSGGKARAEACKKVKQQGGELPSASKEKSLGGAYAI